MIPNLCGYIFYCFNYIGTQIAIFVTIWFANLAKLNIGVVLVIWAITPLMVAFLDFVIFRQRLFLYHLIGMLLMVACAVLLGLKSYLTVQYQEMTKADGELFTPKEDAVFPSWMPVISAIITTLFFSSRGVLIRRLSDEKYGICFNVSTTSMSVFFTVNLIVLCFAIYFWVNIRFSSYFFWLGIVASLIDTVALNCLSISLDKGPMGPASAIANFNTMLLVLVDALKTWKVPTTIELSAVVIGFIGCLVLLIPDHLERLFCFWRKKEERLTID